MMTVMMMVMMMVMMLTTRQQRCINREQGRGRLLHFRWTWTSWTWTSPRGQSND